MAGYRNNPSGDIAIRIFMKRVVGSLTLTIMQTEADAKRLRSLGMDAAKTLVSGNLKFDGQPGH